MTNVDGTLTPGDELSELHANLLLRLGTLAQLIDLELREYDVSFRVSHDEALIPGEAMSLLGRIDGVPVRFDFYSPSVAREGVYAVALFELGPTRFVARDASNVGFADVLANYPWAHIVRLVSSRSAASR